MTAELSFLESLLGNLGDGYGSSLSIGAILIMIRALQLLEAGQQPTVGELSRLTGVPRQTVARWVAHHESRGWLTLCRNDEDERAHLIVADQEAVIRQLRKLQDVISLVQDAEPGRANDSAI